MGDEAVLHFAAIRIRVIGQGNLQLTLKGLDANPTANLPSIVMQMGPGREPQMLCNFINQRVQLRVFVTNLDENFKINRIVLYGKPIYTSYAG